MALKPGLLPTREGAPSNEAMAGSFLLLRIPEKPARHFPEAALLYSRSVAVSLWI